MTHRAHISRLLLVCAASLLLLCCGSGNGDPVKPDVPDTTFAWVQIAEYDLTIPEPSSLVFDEAANRFWIVSDQTGQLHAISKTGIVLQTLPWVGADLEAITIDPTDSTFYVAEERAAAIYHLDRSGHFLNVLQLDETVYGGNHGIEGLAIQPETGHLLALKESDPGRLLVLSDEGEIIEEVVLDFASDYSDLISLSRDTLMILSDEDESVTRFTMDGTVLDTHSLEKISTPEGLALVQDTLYIITDNSAHFAVYVRDYSAVDE